MAASMMCMKPYDCVIGICLSIRVQIRRVARLGQWIRYTTFKQASLAFLSTKKAPSKIKVCYAVSITSNMFNHRATRIMAIDTWCVRVFFISGTGRGLIDGCTGCTN